jgi:hypothetical protein
MFWKIQLAKYDKNLSSWSLDIFHLTWMMYSTTPPWRNDFTSLCILTYDFTHIWFYSHLILLTFDFTHIWFYSHKILLTYDFTHMWYVRTCRYGHF